MFDISLHSELFFGRPVGQYHALHPFMEQVTFCEQTWKKVGEGCFAVLLDYLSQRGRKQSSRWLVPLHAFSLSCPLCR